MENCYEEASRVGGFLVKTGQGLRHQRWRMRNLIRYAGRGYDLTGFFAKTDSGRPRTGPTGEA